MKKTSIIFAAAALFSILPAETAHAGWLQETFRISGSTEKFDQQCGDTDFRFGAGKLTGHGKVTIYVVKSSAPNTTFCVKEAWPSDTEMWLESDCHPGPGYYGLRIEAQGSAFANWFFGC